MSGRIIPQLKLTGTPSVSFGWFNVVTAVLMFAFLLYTIASGSIKVYKTLLFSAGDKMAPAGSASTSTQQPLTGSGTTADLFGNGN